MIRAALRTSSFRLAETGRLLPLALRMVAGRRFWIAALLPLAWMGWSALSLAAGFRQPATDYSPQNAQNTLIGFPLIVLGIGLGVRIIAGEIDRRTLEIAYTVPGGTHRVWLAKLVASLLILIAAEGLLALATWAFFTGFPPTALYGALQAAVTYLVLAMALAALFKSEAAGAMATVVVFIANLLFAQGQFRVLPTWNPLMLEDQDPAEVLAWAVQNRIGFVVIIVVITLLAFLRAENRESLLSG